MLVWEINLFAHNKYIDKIKSQQTMRLQYYYCGDEIGLGDIMTWRMAEEEGLWYVRLGVQTGLSEMELVSKAIKSIKSC